MSDSERIINHADGQAIANKLDLIAKAIGAKAYKTYTVQINLANSSPATWAVYKDDAENNITTLGVGGGENEVDEFMGYYPCLLLNGVEGVKLNPDNYAQDINGNSVDITTGASGDVMVYFPNRGYRIRRMGDTLLCSITDDPDREAEGFVYMTYKGSRCQGVYHSTYEGYEASSKLRSLSGKTPTVSKTIGAFRTLAQANGTGYEQRTYNVLTYLQICALIKYCGKNMQIALGRGFVDGNSGSHATGGTDTFGLNFGETTGQVQMKLFGIEDFWGNIWDWIDGILTDASRNILTADGGFNDSGTGYVNRGGCNFSANAGGYMQKPMGKSTQMGFVPDGLAISGSDSTYFCDSAYVYASCVATFGGDWSTASDAGLFPLILYYAASASHAFLGGRLTYYRV